MPTSARWEVTNSPQIPVKSVYTAGSMWASTPTKLFSRNVGNFELLQISREKSRKTEGVFPVASRGSGGKSKSPRARFLFPIFSFGEAKEKIEGQPLISNMSFCIPKCFVPHNKPAAAGNSGRRVFQINSHAICASFARSAAYSAIRACALRSASGACPGTPKTG